MNLEQIKRTLEEKLAEPLPLGSRRRIIFWYDPEKEFSEEIDQLKLSDCKIWHLERDNNFLTKYTIEELDPASNYLIYFPAEKPADEDNWLLDMLLYSYEFNAERITMVMEDLKAPPSLRPIFNRYKNFFNSQERRRRFARYKITNYTGPMIHSAVLSVLTKQKAVNASDALRAIFCESLNTAENPLWEDVVKFGDEDAFWGLMKLEFGYEGQRDLETLFISLVITAFSEQFKGEFPAAWQRYVSARKANCVVFIDHFMNHLKHGQVFEKLVGELEGTLHLGNYLAEWHLEDFASADIFPSLDKAIIQSILTSLERGADNYEYYHKIIAQRRTKYYYERYKNLYDVLDWAMKLLSYQKQFGGVFLELKAKDLFEAYAKLYYKVDYAYRKYCLAFAEEKGRGFLRALNDRVENLYCNWFLQDLAIKWSELVEEELASNWLSMKVRTQQSFYPSFVAPVAARNERVFVIISDALRYEVGLELTETLNREVRGLAKLEPILGVVPSYTQLGMAVLLPHQRLELANGEVRIDGQRTAGLADREKILQQKSEALALRLPELLAMDRQMVRSTVRGKQVVYIYHDRIDAFGDQARTENETFQAAARTIEEIVEAVDILVKNLTDVTVYITSDHGFIYQRTNLRESDKTPRGGEDAILAGRRYMVFNEHIEVPHTVSIDLKYLFGVGSELTAVVPKANNRYKLQGPGQNYVHGGASLQEIVLPLIHFEKDRKQDAAKEISKTEVTLLSETRRITNSIFTLDFFQSQPVKGKITPRLLKAYFIDPAGSVISDELPLSADQSAEKAEERIFRLRFTLKSQEYDRTTDYYLVLEDLEETVEKIYLKVPFEIDLGIMHQFDF